MNTQSVEIVRKWVLFATGSGINHQAESELALNIDFDNGSLYTAEVLINHFMSNRAANEGFMTVFKDVAKNVTGQIISDEIADQYISSFKSKGVNTWSDLFNELLDLPPNLESIVNNKTKAINEFNTLLEDDDKSHLFNDQTTSLALKNLVETIGVNDSDLTLAKRGINDLVENISDNGIRALAGDGIANATVVFDKNNNGIQDNGESATVTDSNGYFYYPQDLNGGKVIIRGGTDTLSGEVNRGILTSIAGTPVVNAITTLIEAAISNDDSTTIKDATESLGSTLGLPTIRFNPLTFASAKELADETLSATDAYLGLAYQKISNQVKNTINQVASAIEPALAGTLITMDSFSAATKAITSEVKKNYDPSNAIKGSLKLTDLTQLTNILSEAASEMNSENILENAEYIAQVTKASNELINKVDNIEQIAFSAKTTDGNLLQSLINAQSNSELLQLIYETFGTLEKIEASSINDSPLVFSGDFFATPPAATLKEDQSNSEIYGEINLDASNGETYSFTFADKQTPGRIMTMPGLFGTLELDTYNGKYTYIFNNTLDEVQKLKVNQIELESFDILATDQNKKTSPIKLNFQIYGANDAPDIEIPTNNTLTPITLDAISSGQLKASDLDGDPTRFIITNGNLVNGIYSYQGKYGTLSLNSDTGEYSYLPDDTEFSKALAESEVGEEEFLIKASDGISSSPSQSLKFKVQGENDAPILVNKLPSFFLHLDNGDIEDDPYPLGDPFLDIDTNDQLTYQVKQSDGDSLPGWISFNPDDLTLDIERPSYNVNYDANYWITVTATDQNGLSANDTFNISFSSKNTILADTLVPQVNTLPQTDENGYPLSFYSGNDKLTGSYKIEGTYGDLYFNDAGEYYFDVSNNLDSQALGAGEYGYDEFSIQYTDSINIDSEFFVHFDIKGVNDAPVVNKEIDDVTFSDNQLAETLALPQGLFSDIDANDSLSYTATLSDGNDLPEGLVFDETDLEFDLVPADITPGTYEIKIEAYDGQRKATAPFTLTINAAPTLTSVVNPVIEGNSQYGWLIASDLDGDSLEYSISDANELDGLFSKAGNYGNLTLNTTSGLLTYLLDTTSEAFQSLAEDEIAEDPFELLVNDGITTTSQPVSFVVYDKNESPSITLLGNEINTATQGDTVTLTANAFDNDGSISQVIFYANDLEFIGSETGNPNEWSAQIPVDIIDPETWVTGAIAVDNDWSVTGSNISHYLLNGSWDPLKSATDILIDFPLNETISVDVIKGTDFSDIIDLSDKTFDRPLWIYGGKGDQIIGSAGVDYIIGAEIADTITLEGGSDVFVLASEHVNSGNDLSEVGTIQDFEKNSDKIGLYGDLSFDQLDIGNVDGDTVISDNSLDKIFIRLLGSHALTEDDFVSVLHI